MEEVESRFLHLLQPIRDLTKNWEVDVAAQLGEYLEEVRGGPCVPCARLGGTLPVYGGFLSAPPLRCLFSRLFPLPVLPSNPTCTSALNFPPFVCFAAGSNLHFLR